MLCFTKDETVFSGALIRLVCIALLIGMSAASCSAGVTPVHAGCSNDLGYRRGLEALARADGIIQQQRYAEANAYLKEEIAAFGRIPNGPPASDDTGLSLAIADRHEGTGDIQSASAMRRRVLESRLQSFEYICNRQ